MKLFISAALAACALAAPAAAATIINGSFEDGTGAGTGINGRAFTSLAPVGGNSWEIFRSLQGWTTTSGPGIEVQTDQAVGEIDAIFGEHYVELDSNSNSSMTQKVVGLTKGMYELSFWYSPRAFQNANRTGETNTINYMIGSLGSSIFGPGGTPETTVGIWTEIVAKFFIAQDGDYDLTFAAGGTGESYGGFIDNVSIAAVPVPAAGLLLVGALGGLAALRRRKA